MFSLKEKSPHKIKKSRKTVQNRNNSILSTTPPEHFYSTKEPASNQSRISLQCTRTETSEVENLLKKIKDLQQEKNHLNDLVQSTEKELEFCNQVILQFVDLNELMKIKQKSVFDDKNRVWSIPNFLVQQRKTVFPKLQRNQLKEMLQNEMKQRKIVIERGDDLMKEEEMGKDAFCFVEGEGRPVTSAAKYRHSSMYGRAEGYEDSRRSPVLRKTKMKL
jgi:vacuolar-type H+-ATPase subunit I/STV1